MSQIENIIEKFKGGSLSEDQVITSIVSQTKYTDARERDEIVKAWRLLAKTGKLSADKAYDVGCIAADSEVWTILFQSAVFQSDKLIDYAMFASQKKSDRDGHTNMWRAVAVSVDIKLLSVDQMFYVAERAGSEKFSTAVLTSGRLSVADVLTRGLEIFFQISFYIQNFKKFFSEHFDVGFWDKMECLAALKKSKRITSFAWVVDRVALSKEDMDQVIILARALEDCERRLADECVVSPIIMKNQHSVEEVFAIIDKLGDAQHSRLALLSSKKEELSHEQILDLVVREPATKEIIQEARAILAKKKPV